MDTGDRSEASNGGSFSGVRGAGEFPSPTHSTAAGSECSKTLAVTVDGLKAKSFDNDVMCKQLLLSPRSSGCSGKQGGKGKSAVVGRTAEQTYEYDFEEDIIDGFAIASFSSFEDLEEFVTATSSGKLLKPKCTSITSHTLNSVYADESSHSCSSPSIDESNADINKPYKSLKSAVLHKHTVSVSDANSNHSRASEATTAIDYAELDERPPLLSSPDDINTSAFTPRSNGSPQVLSIAVSDDCGSSVLRVPTPSTWEKYKFSNDIPLSPSVECELKDSVSTVTDGLQVKHCDCIFGKNGNYCSNCKSSVDSQSDEQKVSHRIPVPSESQRAVATSPMAISIKIEDSSPPPPSVQQDFMSSKVLSAPYGLFDNSTISNDHIMTKPPNRNSERRDEKPVFVRDSKRHGTTYTGSIKSRHSSPERHSSEIRSVSRSPSVQRCHSRSISSKHSIEIKSEQSTPPPPPVVKKLSSHHSSSDRFTPRCSNPVSAPSSYPLYTPSAVPASYLSHVSNPSSFHYSSSFDSGLSYPFRGLANPSNSLFVPPAPSVNINPSLMMGLQNQFGHDALLNAAANQEVLNRMQQELNSRFLHDRSMLPLGLPSVPFTLHTEMHQHQHLHHHQHVVTPSYLQPPGSAGLFSNQMSMNLNELAERERFAKMASLSGLSGLNVPAGLHNGLSFNQGLHSGAFQPKIPNAASAVSNLTPASQLLLSIRDHENLARNPSIASMAKRRGRWCAAHVTIAWKIHQHKHNKVADAAAFRASLDAAEMASLRAGFGAAEAASMRAQASTDRLRSGLLGGLAGSSEIHSRFLGQGMTGCPPHYSGLDMLGRLAQTGLDLNGGGLFGPPPVNPSMNILRPQVAPSPSMSRHIGSPAPHRTVKPKPEPSRREAPSDRHGASSSSSGYSHRTSVDIKSEHTTNRHRDHHGRPSSSSHTLATGSGRRSPPTDRHHPRHRDRSRSRSPLSSQSSQQVRHSIEISAASSRASDLRGAGKDADVRIGHQRVNAPYGEHSTASMLSDSNLRNGFPPSGHAFSSVSSASKPSAAKTHMSNPHITSLELERDARQQALRQQHERDRLSFGASAAAAAAASSFAASLMPSQMFGTNCDAATAMLLRDRMITDQRDRMLLAAAAAEYESRSLRNNDHTGLRQAQMQSFSALYQPQLPPTHAPDGLLGGASGMMFAAAQSALHRPSLTQSGPSGLKLPSSFGSMMDSSVAGSLNNAAAHLNLPFR